LTTILSSNCADVTWDGLVDLEPRLLSAMTSAEVAQLVGWTAATSERTLRSADAYHVAMEQLLNVSPPLRKARRVT